ncbi:PREDICTED: putative F-box/FBD/LRR-repeat protein At5g22670 [Fragaria vesca subsp. vesca]|uniref:putative F-box/FBD/LRR-repeat protein At5g22670 n=1 Tax=Fragaria vesca subsp. vesca TaxID=101020 RepID=UPI0002C362AD|nr:PREDICTED: putative F-box/FBD/LRR-repeat protein At5g22670 [Fragaria vesca subsp. vesca]
MERKSEKSKGDHYDLEDRITALPDDLLSLIVLRLPVKESAATAILSKRWNTWKSATNLDFSDARFVIAKGYYRFLQLQRPENYQSENYEYSERYVNLVNGAVQQYSNLIITRFRVCFIMYPRFAGDVLNWIQFAMNKKVEILELEFYTDSGYTGDQCPLYPFPKKLLSHHSCEDIGFKFLKVLHFRRVDVTGEVLEYFLSNCAALERLIVNAAHNLVDLRVVGLSISLTHLTLIDCIRLKRIEVRDVKLVSFHLSGMEVENMSLTNVPLLVDVSYMTSIMKFHRVRSIERLFTRLSFCISQLETLRLDISGGGYNQKDVFPILSNLRHLELKLDSHCEDDIPNFKRFIEASPYLHRLVLKLHKCKRTRPGYKCRKMGRISRFPRDYLKVVEIVGYRGTHCHDELALYFVMEAAALEKLVIDPVRRWRDWLDREGELPLP